MNEVVLVVTRNMMLFGFLGFLLLVLYVVIGLAHADLTNDDDPDSFHYGCDVLLWPIILPIRVVGDFCKKSFRV